MFLIATSLHVFNTLYRLSSSSTELTYAWTLSITTNTIVPYSGEFSSSAKFRFIWQWTKPAKKFTLVKKHEKDIFGCVCFVIASIDQRQYLS